MKETSRSEIAIHLAPENREEQTQDDADDDARNDWKIKRAVLAFDTNITGQPAQPFRREAAPQDEPEQKHGPAGNHEEFPNVVHAPEGCAN